MSDKQVFQPFNALSYDKENFRVLRRRVEGIMLTYTGWAAPKQNWVIANDTRYTVEVEHIIRDTPEARKLLGKLKKFDQQTEILLDEFEAKRRVERLALSHLIVYESPNWKTD